MKELKTDRILTAGKTAALIGAGVSNLPLVPFLTGKGVKVTVREKAALAPGDEKYDRITSDGGEVISGDGYLDGLCEDVIFRSPGIRPDIKEFREAEERGSVVTCEMEMFAANSKGKIFAVTGSDGKSTTTTITSMILDPSDGGKTYLGGNIGQPLYHLTDEITEKDLIAVEMSSFQLMEFDSPVCAAAITNITPNHLNWHTGMDEYTEAKKNILKRSGLAVLNFDDERTRNAGMELLAGGVVPVRWFSLRPYDEIVREGGTEAEYVTKDGRSAVYHKAGSSEVLFDLSDVLLPGMHNVANYMTASALAYEYTSPEKIRQVARTFTGVRHRLQLVAEGKGKKYYNSSIDSSPTRTAAAVSALTDKFPDSSVVIICGGYDKNIPFGPLAETILTSRIIKKAVITGATADKILDAVRSDCRYDGSETEIVLERSFDEAVREAALDSPGCDTVLLSPACASFDAFRNFEERGDHFSDLVKELSK